LSYQVYLAAITGYVPSAMVQCIATFMDACYIARRNAITGPALDYFKACVEKFHTLRQIFIAEGVRASISLPRQHALSHYFYSIHLFASPNGLCSSITESKHIKAVKEPWRRSSRYHALIQMLQSLLRMDKMDALRLKLAKLGMLAGSTSLYMAQVKNEHDLKLRVGESFDLDQEDLCHEDDEDDEEGPVAGEPTGVVSDVVLSTRSRMYLVVFG
jgi:hypothetical protein